MDTFSLLAVGPEDGLEAAAAATVALLEPEHLVPMKLTFLFTRAVRWCWYAQTKMTGERSKLLCIWELLERLLEHSEFDGSCLDGLRDDVIKLIWDEYERGTRSCQEAACRLLTVIERNDRLRPHFRHVLQKFVGARVSPSYCAALRACHDPHLMAPVMRLLLDACRRAIDLGTNIFTPVMDSYLEDPSGLPGKSNFFNLLELGPDARQVIMLCIFPPFTTDHTAGAEGKKKTALARGRDLLRRGFEAQPRKVAAFFAEVTEWIAPIYPAAVCIETVQWFQSFLDVSHPDMAALVWAVRGIPDQEWRREWAWKLVSSAVDRLAPGAEISDVALKTLAMVVRVEPTVAFKMVDVGIFSLPVASGEGQSVLMAELVGAYASLRALHELLEFLIVKPVAGAKSSSLRDAYVHDMMRSHVREALRKCLPSVAKALAFVPTDSVSACIVMDILRWGPSGPEAISAGWRGPKWVRRLTRASSKMDSAADVRALHICMLNAVHYRWPPLLLDEMMRERERHNLLDVPDKLQKIRLARDFPVYWTLPAQAHKLCLELLDHGQQDQWALLIWAGGMPVVEKWMIQAPDMYLSSRAELSAAWMHIGCSAESVLAFVEAAHEKTSEHRARILLEAVPFHVLSQCPRGELVVDALVRVKLYSRLADLLRRSEVFHAPARKRWLEEGVALGPAAALALDNEQVWNKALRSPRPHLWSYLAAYGDPEKMLSSLSQAGWDVLQDEGIWDSLTALLEGISAPETWTRFANFLLQLFSHIWRHRQWNTLLAYHDCLKRLGSKGANLVMQKSFALLISLGFQKDEDDDFVSDLLTLADYEIACRAVSHENASLRLLHLFFGLLEHNVTIFRFYVPAFLSKMMQAKSQEDRLLAARCAERLVRLAPPYNPAQLALYLEPCNLDLVAGGTDPTILATAMMALGTARRAAPRVLASSAGLVAAYESRAMSMVSHIPERVKRSHESMEAWIGAASYLGREIGGGGSDLKRRRHHLTFAVADFLTRCEPHASLPIRKAIWDDGLYHAFEAVLASESQQKFSFDLVRGPISNKAAWRRYKRRFVEMEQYQGNV